MSDESEVGIVLANAPRLERAFGRKLAAVITLSELVLLAPGYVALALILQAWLKLRG